MTRKQTEAVSLLLNTMQEYFESQENERNPEERTPVHTISPKKFSSLCHLLNVSKKSAYLLVSFALAIVKGMAENPGGVAGMCGGADGGSLIVALEALKDSMSNNK